MYRTDRTAGPRRTLLAALLAPTMIAVLGTTAPAAAAPEKAAAAPGKAAAASGKAAAAPEKAAVAPAAENAGGTTAAGPAWGACPPPPPEYPRDPRLKCATLRVPLDYRKPHGRQITVTISRLPAADPGLRRGILLTNPGGPGVPGLDQPSLLAEALPAEVVARYDLIGFDPRGVGTSTPVTCGLPVEVPEMVPSYPAPGGSIARNVDFARRTAQACAKHSGALLPHITTANTARDMDRIRAALGERKLSYFGGSYGTYLGAVYTTLFPQRSDRILLDSAIDPNRVWYGIWRTWGEAVSVRLPDFANWAAARDDEYHLGSTPGAVLRTYHRLAGTLDREPREVDGEVVTGNVFREVTRAYLYSDYFFPGLAEIWQILADPEADPGAKLKARMTAQTKPVVDNHYAALFAVVCGDVSWPRDPAAYARNVAADRRAWPVTAGMPANIWPCAFWPYRPAEPPVKVTSKGPRNVLILQNLRDPATSLRSGKGLRVALGGRAAFITQDAGDHGIFGARSGPCVTAIATNFLTRGTLPARDRLCPAPPPVDEDSAAQATRLVPPPIGDLTAQPALTTLPTLTR